jgi:hypothetical protein
MKLIPLFLLTLGFLCISCSERTKTTIASKEDLAQKCIAAINQKDISAYKALLHPICTKQLNGSMLNHYEQIIKMEQKTPVPPDAKIEFKEIKSENDLPLKSILSYEIIPTHQCIIKTEKRTRAFFIIQEDKSWYIYIPQKK